MENEWKYAIKKVIKINRRIHSRHEPKEKKKTEKIRNI